MFNDIFGIGQFIPDTPIKLAIFVFGIISFAKKYIPKKKWDVYIPILSIIFSVALSTIYLSIITGLVVGLVLTGSFSGLKELFKSIGISNSDEVIK